MTEIAHQHAPENEGYMTNDVFQPGVVFRIEILHKLAQFECELAQHKAPETSREFIWGGKGEER